MDASRSGLSLFRGEVVADNARMGSKRKPKQSTEKYRKSTRMARIRRRTAEQLDKAAAKFDKKFTELVNDACREWLERNGLWPPPGPESD